MIVMLRGYCHQVSCLAENVGIALQLAEEGWLNLDQPPHAFCGVYLEGDERANATTATPVLTHNSGLPETSLKIYFAPGERFSYGSSAFASLRRANEILAGCSLKEPARSRVFEIFGMPDSSLHWQDRFDANHAQGQEIDGQPVAKRRPFQAAASLNTFSGGSAKPRIA